MIRSYLSAGVFFFLPSAPATIPAAVRGGCAEVRTKTGKYELAETWSDGLECVRLVAAFGFWGAESVNSRLTWHEPQGREDEARKFATEAAARMRPPK